MIIFVVAAVLQMHKGGGTLRRLMKRNTKRRAHRLSDRAIDSKMLSTRKPSSLFGKITVPGSSCGSPLELDRAPVPALVVPFEVRFMESPNATDVLPLPFTTGLARSSPGGILAVDERGTIIRLHWKLTMFLNQFLVCNNKATRRSCCCSNSQSLDLLFHAKENTSYTSCTCSTYGVRT